MTPNRLQARQFFDRAEAKQDAATDRYRMYVSAVAVDPAFPLGWSGLGHATNEIGQNAASAACYRRALEGPAGVLRDGDLDDELRSKSLCNLALRLHHMGRLDEAEEAARASLAIDPGLARAWSYLSLVASVNGDGKMELACARRGFELEQSPVTELALAFALLFNRRWIEGLRRFESRFPYRLDAIYSRFPMPRWDGGCVGSLMVVCEQGLGDSLSYARFIPEVRRRVPEVLFAVQPELVRFLQPALPGVAVIPYPQTFPAVDAWVPVGSLPHVLGLTDEAFETAPGLAFGHLTEPGGWKLPFRPGHEPFRIGICYAGSPANDIDRWRSIPVEQFLELYRVPGVELYSFQVGDPSRTLHEIGAAGLVRDLNPWIRDVADSAALLRGMDLVVTVESFLGHLAGALALPCWVLYSHHGGDYRIGRDERGALWYPRHRIFKQGADAAWQPVWDRVVAALRALKPGDGIPR